MNLSIPQFPNSQNDPFEITSPPIPQYNCISWAYGISDVRMWPSTSNFYWPSNITNNDKISSFIELYESIGYEVCDDDSIEDGYEKVAIFELNGKATHASRQLKNGNWSSKLGHQPGISFDVSHTIKSISNGVYGDVVVFMKRTL